MSQESNIEQKKHITIMVDLAANKDDPYIEHIVLALQKKGYKLTSQATLSRQWIRSLKKGDVVHFHWLEPFYLRTGFFATLSSLCAFFVFLLLLLLNRVRVVWTVHNLFPHSKKHRLLSFLATSIMLFFSSSLIFTGKQTLHKFRWMFWKKKKVIPLNHEYAYHKAIPKKEARKKLTLDKEKRYFLAFGRVRHYKGFAKLCSLFGSLVDQGEVKDSVELLVVGHPEDAQESERIRQLAAKHSQIHFIDSFIPAHDVHLYFSAADIVVLPYNETTTSGPLALSLLFGKPIIIRDTGTIRDSVADNALLVSTEQDLRNALLSSQDFSEKKLKEMGKISRSLLASFDEIVAAHEAVYLE